MVYVSGAVYPSCPGKRPLNGCTFAWYSLALWCSFAFMYVMCQFTPNKYVTIRYDTGIVITAYQKVQVTGVASVEELIASGVSWQRGNRLMAVMIATVNRLIIIIIIIHIVSHHVDSDTVVSAQTSLQAGRRRLGFSG